MSVTFDTNLLIYACDQRDQAKRDRAITLFKQNPGAVLLWQVACEFIAASRKLAPQGFAVDSAWQQLDAYMGVFQLVTPSENVLRQAKTIHVRDRVAFWDAIILAACHEAGVTRLYSEDLPGRVRPSGIEVINPFV